MPIIFWVDVHSSVEGVTNFDVSLVGVVETVEVVDILVASETGETSTSGPHWTVNSAG